MILAFFTLVSLIPLIKVLVFAAIAYVIIAYFAPVNLREPLLKILGIVVLAVVVIWLLSSLGNIL